MYTETREFKIIFIAILTLIALGLLAVAYGLQVKITSGNVEGISTVNQICKPNERRSCGTCNTCEIEGACVSACNQDGSGWECIVDVQMCAN